MICFFYISNALILEDTTAKQKMDTDLQDLKTEAMEGTSEVTPKYHEVDDHASAAGSPTTDSASQL